MIEARIRASIDAYVAAWNEADAAARMRLIEHACAEDFSMRTPGMRRVRGRAELDAMIADYQQRRPGERAVMSSAVDVQGSIFRYTGRVEGATVPRGDALDVGECDEDGRIRLLLTFAGATLPGSAEGK